MDIAIIGAGNVGIPLTRALSAAGHDVRLANSRGPESIRDLAASLGATAATAADAVRGAQAVIVSVPPTSLTAVRSTLDAVPGDVRSSTPAITTPRETGRSLHWMPDRLRHSGQPSN